MTLFRQNRWFLNALLISALAACGGGDGAQAPMEVGEPVPGGTAIVAINSDFQDFNPVINTALITGEVINFMLFTPLVQFDSSLNAVPALAESWDLTDEGVTFRLHDNLRWHDGQPVTAEDVKFTFDLAKNPETASLLESAYLSMVESATVVDPHTIRFDFVAPHSQPLQGFWWAPVPQHLLGSVTAAQLPQASFNRQPVGNGPFRFVSWAPDEQAVFEANPDYPAELGGRPLLDRIVFRIVPEATTRLTEVLTGATDVSYPLLPDEARQVESQNQTQLVQYPGREFLYIGWNNEREPFRDPRVRRALTMATDRNGLIESLMYGHAAPAASMIPAWSPVAPDIQPVPYDPEGARRLLQEAGWAPGPDGILMRNGQPLRFTLQTSEDRLRQDIAVVLQQQLRQIGVDAQVRASEFQTFLDQHRNREYEAVVSGWSLDSFRVDPTPLFSCEEARTPRSANRAGYCNPDVDRLIEAGLRETDDNRAREIWGEFSRIIQEDTPISFILWQEQLAARNPRLQGVLMDVRGRLQSAPRWWIPEAMR